MATLNTMEGSITKDKRGWITDHSCSLSMDCRNSCRCHRTFEVSVSAGYDVASCHEETSSTRWVVSVSGTDCPKTMGGELSA